MVVDTIKNLQAPETKVNVGVGMTFLSTIGAWLLAEFAGITVPTEVGIAIAGFLSFLAQYIVPNG